MSKKHITIELPTSKEFNSLPIETRELNETYQLNENWQIINQTSYEIDGKYPSKKIVRAYGIFFEKEIIEINDIINLFQK